MKRVMRVAAMMGLLLGIFLPHESFAATAVTAAGTNSAAKVVPPGAVMAHAVSTITGVAISPLLGASAYGAWKYWMTPMADRAHLPWYAQPWFWIPAFVIVGLCALKDTFGMTVPAILKKPFDVLEAIAHKASGLIALGVFVPMIASVFHSAGATPPLRLDAMMGHGFIAMIQPASVYNLCAYALSAFVFIVVFFASNAINILILLSPFPAIDALLKLFRLTVLFTVAATSLLNPWLGLFWSLVIIIIAWCISGWSFRLSHFGLTFIWEFCTFARTRFHPDPKENWMFLGRTINKVPTRMYGKLLRDDSGQLVFLYHPWLILPQRKLVLPSGTYAVSKGLVYSEIVRLDDGAAKTMLLLPPKYRTHEAELSMVYAIANRSGGLLAAFEWLGQWIGFKATPKVIDV